MCLHGSLEINIPVLLRGHSTLEFVITAGTVQQEHSALLFPSVFLTIFTQAVSLFNVSWAAPWQYCTFFQQGMATSNHRHTNGSLWSLEHMQPYFVTKQLFDCKAWVPPLWKGTWLLNHNHLWKQNLIHYGVNWFLRSSVMASFFFWAPGSHPTSLALSGIHITMTETSL